MLLARANCTAFLFAPESIVDLHRRGPLF
jgi:hypothetical protein